MAQDKRDDFLYLTWGDPNSGKRFIVGKLTRGERFVFEYTECSGAEKCGWERLEAFPEEKRYESEKLFSIFSSRLPNPKRRDMDKILEKYGLAQYDGYELLRKNGGRLPIDTYEFICPESLDCEKV